jgi:hypothetical protein
MERLGAPKKDMFAEEVLAAEGVDANGVIPGDPDVDNEIVAVFLEDRAPTPVG